MNAPNHRNNSFDFIRFAAAVSVLISHHFALSGFKEPYIPVFRDTLGGSAVAVFFIVSGYLICESLKRSNRWHTFFAARILRIMPNLAFALIVTSAVTLFWFSNFTKLGSHVEYVTHNLGMFFHGVKSRIPGVLTGQPYPSVNGSLWTLPYEFWLYVALFCIFLLPPRFRITALLVTGIAVNGLWLLASEKDKIIFLRYIYVGKLGLYFFSGALVSASWSLISSRRLLAVFCSLLGISVSRLALPTENFLYTASLATLVILLCTTTSFATFGRYGDASFGIYIFAFPVQQLAILAIGDFWLSITVALVITITLGYGTWHTFEERCLRFRPRLALILSGARIFSEACSKSSGNCRAPD